jgi:hypothetical protein
MKMIATVSHAREVRYEPSGRWYEVAINGLAVDYCCGMVLFGVNPKSMRIIYLDEAGIASEEQEPITVVAGVVIDADRHWLSLEQQIGDLLADYIPIEDRENFEFHGKNLFSGSTYFNKHFGKDRRHELFSRFLALLPNNDIPVKYSAIDRAGLKRANPEMAGMELGLAYLMVLSSVEFWFQQNAPHEVGLCIGDENKIKTPIKRLLRQYRKEPLVREIIESQLRHLIDTVWFNRSEESLGLQLADACSFLIKRHLMKKTDSVAFYKIIEPQIDLRPTMFGED